MQLLAENQLRGEESDAFQNRCYMTSTEKAEIRPSSDMVMNGANVLQQKCLSIIRVEMAKCVFFFFLLKLLLESLVLVKVFFFFFITFNRLYGSKVTVKTFLMLQKILFHINDFLNLNFK